MGAQGRLVQSSAGSAEQRETEKYGVSREGGTWERRQADRAGWHRAAQDGQIGQCETEKCGVGSQGWTLERGVGREGGTWERRQADRTGWYRAGETEK